MAGRRFARSEFGSCNQDTGHEPVSDGAVSVIPSRQALIGQLNQTVARMEGRSPELESPAAGENDRKRAKLVPTGIGEMDAALSGGLRVNALHEIRAAIALDLPAAAGFALTVVTLMAGRGTPVFWISQETPRLEAGAFYGPGLAALGFGCPPFVRVAAENCEEALWAAGEVAACPGAGVCLLELRGNPARADLGFSRRLALRSQASGTPVILLRHSGEEEASAAATRWRVSPLPSRIAEEMGGRNWIGPPAWEVALEKCRGGRTGTWKLEWRHDECQLALSSGDTGRHTLAAAPIPAGPGAPLPGGQPASDSDRQDRARALGSELARKRAS